TRMLAGPADYHLGGFRAVPDSLFKVQYTRPLMLGTRCHMLAMYVVLENPQGMVCDYPAAYEGQPGFDFLKQVPTIWDETKVLDAKLREYIIVARRKDNAWYIGSINNSTAREISIPFHFLDEGEYLADIYTDSEDAGKNPDHLVKQSRAIKNTDEISLHMAAGGGLVMQLKRK
ncbi:MAG: glycoside hydrolase family 97 C-terminal domain-containing protein, partial [Chitinophagaceae bacterium]